MRTAGRVRSLSGPDLPAPGTAASMAERPAILAHTEPMAEVAREAARAAVIAAGRPDVPNQAEDVPCFPFVLSGALDVGAAHIDEATQAARADAAASLAREAPPADTAGASRASGRCSARPTRSPIPPIRASCRWGPARSRGRHARGRARAARVILEGGPVGLVPIGHIGVIGRREDRAGLSLPPEVEARSPERDECHRDERTSRHAAMVRHGATPRRPVPSRTGTAAIAGVMVARGGADGPIRGAVGRHLRHLDR